LIKAELFCGIVVYGMILPNEADDNDQWWAQQTEKLASITGNPLAKPLDQLMEVNDNC